MDNNYYQEQPQDSKKTLFIGIIIGILVVLAGFGVFSMFQSGQKANNSSTANTTPTPTQKTTVSPTTITTPTASATPTTVATVTEAPTATPTPQYSVYSDPKTGITFDIHYDMTVKAETITPGTSTFDTMYTITRGKSQLTLEYRPEGGIGCAAFEPEIVSVDRVITSSKYKNTYFGRKKVSDGKFSYGLYSSPVNGQGSFSFCNYSNLITSDQFKTIITSMTANNSFDIAFFDGVIQSLKRNP